MSRSLAFSQLRVFTFAFTLLLPIAIRSTAYQPQLEQPNANELRLTAAQEKDSYEIYSILLRTELPRQWNITAWAIKQETQTFPISPTNDGTPGACLQPPQDQQSIY